MDVIKTLTRIIYISDFDEKNLSSDVVSSILTSAKKNNKNLNITGMLLFDYKHFIQVLEGPEESVVALYDSIRRDRRHSNVRTVEKTTVEQRRFGHWDMGFAHLEQASADTINFDSPDAHALLTLLQAEAVKRSLEVHQYSKNK